MKKTIIIIFLFSVTTRSFAAMPRFCVQFKGGMNLAGMYGKDVDYMIDSSDFTGMPRVGAIGGIGLQLKIIDHLLIRPEALFTMKGIVYEKTVDDETIQYRKLYTYLDFPLYMIVTIPVKGRFYPHMYAGPTWSVNLTARDEYIPDPLSINRNKKEDTAPLDVGLGMGAGASIISGQTIISFEVRYTLGFKTTDDRESDFIDKDDTKNRVLSFILSFAPSGRKQ
jgi:hypothetical protein